MKLSIVIVNYNVEHFLEQCLRSVFIALDGIEGEVWVVDNHSVDGSLKMLKEKFPQVKLIANQENVGFARANNQAIRQSTGEYVLLLNPDTLVESDTFSKCLEFMDAHPDGGGLGVKMVNGKGEFLPESKRGLPLPSVAFYKIFGLSKLFPKSRKFGSYHLTYLDKDEINPVDVLSGAFMLLRRKALDEVGLLDEDYFMYGEDIDLSYRITQGGYKNYYFPQTRIIHYKGESTKKSSVNYVVVFYRAMQIFAQKHFSHKNAGIFNFMINFAIWFRAGLDILLRVFAAILLPLCDFVLCYLGIFCIAKYWDSSVLATRQSAFPDIYFYLVIPIYIIVWLMSVAFCGGYRAPVQARKTNRGIIIGTVCILLIYALLPESARFSRAVTLLGAGWTVIALNLIRYLMHKFNIRSYMFGGKTKRRIAIVGNASEAERVASLVQMLSPNCEYIGLIGVSPEECGASDKKTYERLGTLSQMKDILSIYRMNEVIFCSAALTSDQIIEQMGLLQDMQVEFKIASPDSSSIIGSSAIDTSDDVYSVPIHLITLKDNKLKKRAFDIFTSLILLLFIWADIWFPSDKGGFLRNIFAVMAGKKSWVGYQPTNESGKLPPIKQGVLFPTDALTLVDTNEEIVHKANVMYSRNYSFQTDMTILWRGRRFWGRW